MKLIVAFLAAIFLVLGCASKRETPAVADRPIRIVTTTAMIGDAAEHVGGTRVDVQALMGPGTDPHLYKATAGDVRTLEGADIILYNGLELEGRMAEIFAAMGDHRPTVAVAEGVPPDDLLKIAPHKSDPHVWFDVQLWKRVVVSVRDALSNLDPTSAKTFDENAEAYLRELEELDRWVIDQFESIPREQRVLVTAHDAFGYMGKRYGIEVMGIQGTSTATEASASDIQRLSRILATRKVKAIFVESSVPQSTVEALQKAVASRGWNIKIGGELFSDAMGAAGTEEGTYVGMVRYNVRTIVGALR